MPEPLEFCPSDFGIALWRPKMLYLEMAFHVDCFDGVGGECLTFAVAYELTFDVMNFVLTAYRFTGSEGS